MKHDLMGNKGKKRKKEKKEKKGKKDKGKGKGKGKKQGEKVGDDRADTLEEVIDNVLSAWNRPWEKLLGQMGKDFPRYAKNISVFVTSEIYEVLKELDIMNFYDDTDHEGNVLVYSSVPYSWSGWYKDEPIVGDDRDPINQSDNRVCAKMMDILMYLQLVLEAKKNPEADLMMLQKDIENSLSDHFGHIDGDARDLQYVSRDYLDKLGRESDVIKVLRVCTQGHFAPCTIAMMYGFGMEDIMNNSAHEVIFRFGLDSVEVIHYRVEGSHWGSVTWQLSTMIQGNDLDQIESINFDILAVKLYTPLSERVRTLVTSTLSNYADESLFEE